MKLKIYLLKNRLSVKEFSEMIDHSRTHISCIVNEKFLPSPKLARIISKATNGEVTVEELLQGSE